MRTLFAFSGKTAGGLLASSLLTMSMSTITHATTWIYGTPTTSVAENRWYGFQSWSKDNDGKAITYGIKNKPLWATFDTKYGHLYGVPTAANVGTYSNIVIYATDGVSSASLPPFSIAVTGPATGGGGTSGGGTPTTTGSATINWLPPTQNTNGSTLTDLAGYTIHYGTSASSLSSSVQVGNPGLTSYQVDGLPSGHTYYFAVSAYNSSGQSSALSGEASKAIN
jgi:hypothetical protein